jgi:hypothetical protein
LLFSKKSTDVRSVRITNSPEAFGAIQDSINHNIDSLEKWLGAGLLYFRMKLDREQFTDVECDQKESPLLLIKLVTAALKAQRVETDNNIFSGCDFILPVAYNFYTSTSSETMKAEELLRKMPKLDLSKPFNDRSSTFNDLFKIEDSSLVVYGVKCFLLPSITLQGRKL